MQVSRDSFIISTNPDLLDIPFIHHELSHSYWAESIPLEIVEKSIRHALCFGIYHEGKQIGFARVISDYATFGYLADVFVIEQYRKQGLSKWLMEVIMAHPELQGLRRFMLATRDAHELYKKYGFTPLTNPERIMAITYPDIYKKQSETSGNQS